MDNNYNVRKVDLPRKVKAVTLPNADGTFDIYINGNLSDDQQFKAFLHELSHIRKNHFYKEMPINVIETEANDLSDKKGRTSPEIINL